MHFADWSKNITGNDDHFEQRKIESARGRKMGKNAIIKEEKDLNEEIEASGFYWLSEAVKKTGISCRDFVNQCEVMGLASLLSQKYDHGAGLVSTRSRRYVKSHFLNGKREQTLINTDLNDTDSRVAMASLIVRLDGAGAVVGGKIRRVGSMIAMSKKSCEKALNWLNDNSCQRVCNTVIDLLEKDGTHTRHGSMAAFSMKCPNSVDMVVSHRGRACILVHGRVVGLITRIEDLDGPVFIRRAGPGFPEDTYDNWVGTSSMRVKNVLESGFKSGDLYLKYVLKNQAETRWYKKMAATHFVPEISLVRPRYIHRSPLSLNLNGKLDTPLSVKGLKPNRSMWKHEVFRQLNFSDNMSRDLKISSAQTTLDKFIKFLNRVRGHNEDQED